VSKFLTLGVEIFAAADQIPVDSEFAWLFQGMKFHEGRAYVKSSTKATQRGIMAKIVDGSLPYTHKVPYGLDRMYATQDGTPLHIIRNLPDGRQAQLDPDTLIPMLHFDKNDKKKLNHYAKQRYERVGLVKGAPNCVRTVQRIFQWKFIDGWGCGRIARVLNNEGVPAVTGGPWHTASIQHILENSIYVGRGLTNRLAKGLLFKRDVSGPIELPKNRTPPQKKRGDGKRKTLPPIARPTGEWLWVEYDHLKDFLGFEQTTTDEIFAWQKTKAEMRSMACTLSASRDRHIDSPYFLKGILRCKQGDMPMSGHSSSPRGEKRRYYRVTRARTIPQDDCIYTGSIPAEVIEDKVLDVLQEVLNCPEVIGQEIAAHVKELLASTTVSGSQLEELYEERHMIESKLEMILDSFGPESRELIKKKAHQLESQLQAVNLRIGRTEHSSSSTELDMDGIVAAVTEQLCDIGRVMREHPVGALRNVASALVPKLVVDLETRAVEMEVALPTWAVSKEARILDVRLDTGLRRKSSHEENNSSRIPLAAFSCTYKSVKRAGCLTCNRVLHRPLKFPAFPIVYHGSAQVPGTTHLG
jgi:hypothetical protein